MKKVLIITKDFVPSSPSFGACARCVYLADFLTKNGFKVFVLARGGQFNSYFGHDGLSESVATHYVHPISTSGVQEGAVKTRSVFKRIASWLSQRYVVPDHYVFDVPGYWARAQEIINSEKPDTVIVSSPPHGLNVLVLLLKSRYPSIKVILDYRDSWNTQPIFRKKSILAARASEWLERMVLRKVDLLTHVSPVVPDLIEEQLSVKVKDKSALVMNGFPEFFLQDATKDVFHRPEGAPLVVGYFGAINDRKDGYRDISFVFECLDNSSDSVSFKFWGELELTSHKLKDYSPYVSYEGQVTHREAISAARECDVLLIVHTDPVSAREVIPGKFFDYLAARKPIVCVAPHNAQVAKLVNLLGVGVVVDPSDKGGLAERFREGLHCSEILEWKGAKLSIDEFTRESQYKKLLELI